MKLLIALLLFASGRAIDPARSFTCARVEHSYYYPWDLDDERCVTEYRDLCAHTDEPYLKTNFDDLPKDLREQCEGVRSVQQEWPRQWEEEALDFSEELRDQGKQVLSSYFTSKRVRCRRHVPLAKSVAVE